MIGPKHLHPIPLPDAHIERRLQQILRRGSMNVGGNALFDRLMLMMTRSCELRCAYCMVGLTEDHFGVDHPGTADESVFATDPPGDPKGDISLHTLKRSIDFLMRSTRPRLGIQFFGGEPSRLWDRLVATLEYAWTHPERGERPMEFLFTTNGVGMTAERLERIAHLPVTIQFSLDGDERGSRFRRGHLLAHDDAVDRMMRTVTLLNDSGQRWFMNSTLPPAAAKEMMDRYFWARERGIPALQMNYATGIRWKPEQFHTYLTELQRMLLHHHRDPGELELFNWRNQADPVPLCGDIIVDVDGTIYQVGCIFHEERWSHLKTSYRRGHLDDELPFTGLRHTLQGLLEATEAVLPDKEMETFRQNIRLGAGQDLAVQLTKKRLGRGERAAS